MEQPARLPIALDAMGGDLGPTVAVEGALQAARELGIASLIVGDESQLKPALAGLGGDPTGLISFHHASEVVTMDDTASTAIRGKPDASVRVAFDLVVRGEAAAVVSPGNTGAVMAAGLFISGTLPGIARPAIASLVPRGKGGTPAVLLDCGANIDCHAYQLVQFAIMGECYARSALSCESPRVALLSNGSERGKGTDIIRSAAETLEVMEGMNFIGYVEGRDLSKDVADVIVCDGFVGNVVLKTMEGTAELVLDSIKQYVERSPRGKVGMWLAKPMLKSLFKDRLDPSSYGGAPLLGLNHIGLVCHGSAGAWAFRNALRVANRFVESELLPQMREALSSMEIGVPNGEKESVWNRIGKRFDRERKRRAEGDDKARAAAASEPEK